MKKNVIILNFSRDLLVNEKDIIDGIEEGKIGKYVTDFPKENLIDKENVIVIPHLGASTEESLVNCGIMAINQLKDYLENGNIVNSVNYPNCSMGVCAYQGRISLLHKNIPNMISQVATVLGKEGINIADMTNKSKGQYAYTLIDTDSEISTDTVKCLKAIEGMCKVRIIK